MFANIDTQIDYSKILRHIYVKINKHDNSNSRILHFGNNQPNDEIIEKINNEEPSFFSIKNINFSANNNNNNNNHDNKRLIIMSIRFKTICFEIDHIENAKCRFTDVMFKLIKNVHDSVSDDENMSKIKEIFENPDEFTAKIDIAHVCQIMSVYT